MKLRSAAMMAGLAFAFMSGSAEAAYIFSFVEIGGNVLVTGHGSFGTVGLRPQINEFDRARVEPRFSFVDLQNVNTENGKLYFVEYTGSGPIGSGQATNASSQSGPGVGVSVFEGGTIVVPLDYVSGTEIGASTATFDGANFASLGLNRGTYTYTYSYGFEADLSKGFASALFEQPTDTVTIQVGTVPLPASSPMFSAALLGLAGLGYATKRKKAAAV